MSTDDLQSEDFSLLLIKSIHDSFSIWKFELKGFSVRVGLLERDRKWEGVVGVSLVKHVALSCSCFDQIFFNPMIKILTVTELCRID